MFVIYEINVKGLNYSIKNIIDGVIILFSNRYDDSERGVWLYHGEISILQGKPTKMAELH